MAFQTHHKESRTNSRMTLIGILMILVFIWMTHLWFEAERQNIHVFGSTLDTTVTEPVK